MRAGPVVVAFLLASLTAVGGAIPAGALAGDLTARAHASPAIASRASGPRPGVHDAAAGPATIYPNCTVSPGAPLARSGGVFTLTGDYAGSVLDECAGSFLNGDGATITSSAALLFGVSLNTTANVTVENLTVAGDPVYGVAVLNTSDALVENVSVAAGVGSGVYAVDDSGVVVDRVGANGTTGYGVFFGVVSGGRIAASYAEGGSTGFAIEGSSAVALTSSNGDANPAAVVAVGSTNVTLAGDELNGAEVGIYAVLSSGLHVRAVNSTDSEYGIFARQTDDLAVADSNFSDATDDGLNALLADGLELSDSNLSGAADVGVELNQSSGAELVGDLANSTGGDGIDVQDSAQVTLEDSFASADRYTGLRIANSSGVASVDDHFDDETAPAANGTLVSHSSNVSVTGDSDDGELVGLLDAGSSGVAVTAANASHDFEGFAFVNDRGIALDGLSAFHDSFGVTLVGSTDDSVAGTSVVDPVAEVPELGSAGFDLEFTDEVTLANSSVRGAASTPATYGVEDVNGTSDLLENLSVSDVDYGVWANITLNSTFDAVNVSAATDAALALNGTFGLLVENGNFSDSGAGFTAGSLIGADQILGNTFYNDTEDFAFAADHLFDVAIYWNNFIDGHGWSVQADGASNASVRFADGYPGGGNYWSNWTSPDTQHGPYQNLSGPDGIVDQPLLINGSIEDPYPLTFPISLSVLSVTFNETGLPAGDAWTVNFNGTNQTTVGTWMSFPMNVAAFGFPFDYYVTAPSGWRTEPSVGLVVTDGRPQTVTIDFLPDLWPATINASGLPAGNPWTISLNGTSYTSIMETLELPLADGTYPFSVLPVAGYVGSPMSGDLVVRGGPASLNLTFVPVLYPISVTERGLPAGTNWSVTLGSATRSSTSATISFAVANGSVAFAVANVTGYSLENGAGSLTIAGTGVAIFVGFVANATSPSSATSSPLFWGLLAVIGVLAIALVVVALSRGRRRAPPTAGSGAPVAAPAAGPTSTGAPAEGPGPPTPPEADWKE